LLEGSNVPPWARAAFEQNRKRPKKKIPLVGKATRLGLPATRVGREWIGGAGRRRCENG